MTSIQREDFAHPLRVRTFGKIPVPAFVKTASYVGTQEVVDTTQSVVVSCTQIGREAIPPDGSVGQGTFHKDKTMTLTLKGLSKNGRAAFYSGAVTPIRLNLATFPNKTAPATIEVPDGTFAAGKAPKVKLTKEERAALPKPTLAEKIAKREAQLAKDKAKLAAANQM